jgi:hypothetical protein
MVVTLAVFKGGGSMSYKIRLCPCGSGKESWWENDARGIPLARVCTKCKREKLARYRPEVLHNPRYSADEAIEPDEY